MRVLVCVASRHHSTAEVGDEIVRVLESEGIQIERRDPDQVRSVKEYDALILGSAVYMTQWIDSMRRLVDRCQADIAHIPTWAFSVGLSGVSSGAISDPSRVGPVLLRIDPVAYETFAGRLDPTKLSLRERTIARLGGAIEGDYRDWEAIRAFGHQIARRLNKMIQSRAALSR